MFTQQRRVMRAGGLTLWLLIPPILIGLLVSALYITTAALNAQLFTELLGERRYRVIVTLIVAVATLLLLRPLLDVAGQLVQNRAGRIVKGNLRQALLKEIDRQGPMRVGLGRSGNIQSVITDGVEAIEPYFIKYFTQLAVTAVTALAITVMLARISLVIAVVLLLCGIGVVAIPRIWDKALAERGQSHWIAYETLNADFIDAMMGMSTLKSFGAADSYGQRLHRQSSELLASTLGQLRLSLGETGLSGMMKVLGPALALIIALGHVRSGSMEIEHLFLVTLLSVEMFRPFTLLSSCWHESFFGVSALPSMNEIFTRIPHAERNARQQRHPDRSQPLDTSLGISFKNVSYRYLGANDPAIEDMSFHIEAGTMTSIVGLSGSGKSTALGLLNGYDQPDSGSIQAFGCSPAQADMTTLVTLVPQEPIIFPGTVREILRGANPSAGEAEMLRALQIAQADRLHQEFAAEATTPDSQPAAGAMAGSAAIAAATPPANSALDLRVLEHAKNLSGGQKQRLAIARALVRNTPILVFDESTSALDSHTEHQLLTQLRAAYPDLTLIFVTHRIDTAAHSDHVIVLSHRQVSCAGSPDELSADPDSTWSRLLTVQQGGR